MTEELAIIRDIDFGCRDIGRPCIWFVMDVIDGGALHVSVEQDALDLVKGAGVYSIKELNGRPCIVEVSQNRSLVHFKRFC